MNSFLRNERGSAARWIILIIIVGACVYGYQHFKKTPRYALIQVKKAVAFSNVDTAQEFMDIDKVASRLPESITKNQPVEVVKKQLLYELDSPHEKSPFIKSIKGWSVFRVPISVSADELYATAETADNTSVSLEKTTKGQWIITAIEIK